MMRHHRIGKWIHALAITWLLGISVTAIAGPTTTTLTANPTSALINQNVVLVATVVGSTPTGAVTFKDGTTTIGTVNTTGSGASRTATINKTFSVTGVHSITAVYAGDADDDTSTSAVTDVTVSYAVTTTTLAANPSAALINQNVVLVATVAGSTPTGTVTFKDGANTLGSANTSGSGTTRTATLTRAFSTTGIHSITAVYAGDTDDATSTSAITDVTVSYATTNTVVSTNPSPGYLNDAVILTAAVTGFTPTGSVTFKDGATTLGTANTSGSGATRTATLSKTFSTTGIHSISAVYAGDTDDATSTSVTTDLDITIATTTAVLTAPATAPLNQSIALVASVSGYSPTGTVTFKEGATTLGTASLSGTGTTRTATLNKSFTTMGAHDITAIYAGDSSDTTSTSAAITINITPAVTTASLVTNPTSAILNQNVVLTATIVGNTPTGTVTFKDGTTTLGTATLSGSGTSRTATLNTSFSTVGTHNLTVEFAGDTDDASSISAIKNIAISTITSTVLNANTSSAAVNSNITYTATVTGVNPTGTISFKESGTTIGSAALANINGVMKASLTTSFPNTGNYSLTASYAGDSQNLPSNSAAISTQVISTLPAFSITAPTNNANFVTGANINITTNAIDSDGTITQVAFYEGMTLLGTATTNPFSFNWTNVPNGSYTLSAIATDYNGVATAATSPVLVTVTTGTAIMRYIHTDQLDTPRLITDTTNTPVWRWDNTDPFGNNAVNDDPNNTGNHFTFNQRFPGQYYDQETNTHYNYFRDYDPSTGRYIESDPIGLEGGINTYAYVEANPLSLSDPKGLESGNFSSWAEDLYTPPPTTERCCEELSSEEFAGCTQAIREAQMVCRLTMRTPAYLACAAASVEAVYCGVKMLSCKQVPIGTCNNCKAE